MIMLPPFRSGRLYCSHFVLGRTALSSYAVTFRRLLSKLEGLWRPIKTTHTQCRHYHGQDEGRTLLVRAAQAQRLQLWRLNNWHSRLSCSGFFVSAALHFRHDNGARRFDGHYGNHRQRFGRRELRAVKKMRAD